MGPTLRCAIPILAGLLAATQDEPKPKEDPFGTPYIIKVQAKTRWSTSFRQADFDKQLKKQKDNLRFTGRAEIADDKAGWDEWTFEVSQYWLFDLDIIQLVYGRHILIRRFDIEIEGVVKADARNNYLLTHPGSGKILRLHNRPKLPRNTEDPPDIRSRIAAAVKEGHKTFRVTGEIIVDGSPVILLASAAPLDEVKK
jgi:hypothetical protein